jgi:hypothetical protein
MESEYRPHMIGARIDLPPMHGKLMRTVSALQTYASITELTGRSISSGMNGI